MLAEARAESHEGLGRSLPIRLSRISRYEDQPRLTFDQKGIIKLADSIQRDGQQLPVIVCKVREQEGFTLVDGERRWRAFHTIKERTGTDPLVNAVIQEVKDAKEHFKRSVIANLHREDLPDLDEASLLHRLHSEGETYDDLAILIGKSKSYVQNYIRVHTLPDSVKEMMSLERPREVLLTITAAIEIARIPDASLQEDLAKEAIQRHLSVEETRVVVAERFRKEGYDVGGLNRRPSDDYKLFTAKIGRMLSMASEITKRLDLDELYLYRDAERDDREYDGARVNAIIAKLRKTGLQLSEKKMILDEAIVNAVIEELRKIERRISKRGG